MSLISISKCAPLHFVSCSAVRVSPFAPFTFPVLPRVPTISPNPSLSHGFTPIDSRCEYRTSFPFSSCITTVFPYGFLVPALYGIPNSHAVSTLLTVQFPPAGIGSHSLPARSYPLLPS